jgi:hypothetical protein
MTNNNHKSVCGFSETLVSYLYVEEIGAAEKLRFERHVLTCRECSDELSAFGGIRSAMQNWREEEFAALSTPVFELPKETAKQSAASQFANEQNYPGRIARWRELFSLNRLRTAGAAAAFAAVAICFGLFYFATLTPNDGYQKDMAEINQPELSPPASASVSPTADDSTSTVNNEESNKSAPETAFRKNSVAPDSKANLTKPAARETVKAVSNEASKVSTVKSNVRPKPVIKTNSVPASPRRAIGQRAPEIEFSSRVEEDRSLRLMDLFDEIGKL